MQAHKFFSFGVVDRKRWRMRTFEGNVKTLSVFFLRFC